MKKLLLCLVGLSLTLNTSLAQGWVTLQTSIFGDGARVQEAEGFAGGGFGLGNTAAGVAHGTNFLMQFYAAAGLAGDSAQFVPIGNPVNSRSGNSNNGFFQESGTTTLGQVVNPIVTIPFIAPGGDVTLQLRAWWAGPNGNTYLSFESAVQSGDLQMRFGSSSLLYLERTGNPLAEPPELPVNLNGFQGFQLQVPEPGIGALVGLGLLVSGWRRRA